jgi:hypothetical protein
MIMEHRAGDFGGSRGRSRAWGAGIMVQFMIMEHRAGDGRRWGVLARRRSQAMASKHGERLRARPALAEVRLAQPPAPASSLTMSAQAYRAPGDLLTSRSCPGIFAVKWPLSAHE